MSPSISYFQATTPGPFHRSILTRNIRRSDWSGSPGHRHGHGSNRDRALLVPRSGSGLGPRDNGDASQPGSRALVPDISRADSTAQRTSGLSSVDSLRGERARFGGGHDRPWYRPSSVAYQGGDAADSPERPRFTTPRPTTLSWLTSILGHPEWTRWTKLSRCQSTRMA
jgi:hypothetical protein